VQWLNNSLKLLAKDKSPFEISLCQNAKRTSDINIPMQKSITSNDHKNWSLTLMKDILRLIKTEIEKNSFVNQKGNETFYTLLKLANIQQLG